ncbi:MAG: hypothetical protein DRP74_08175 [Candidatus Omnitrophota bacterium]|nr:MAG: hypothetical protein DRP74_08175 [Candidatus Omnitrophota bacterium]
MSGETPNVPNPEKIVSIKEKIQKAVQKLVQEVKETGRPASIEIMETDRWVLQILVVPPGTVRYGATTVQRQEPGVLLSIRSRALWRNNLTIRDLDGIMSLKRLIDEFVNDKELFEAVGLVLTTKETTPVRKVSLDEI